MSLRDLSKMSEGGAPTHEELERIFASIRNAPMPAPHGTKDNPHLIHPETQRRGYGRCVECGLPLGNWPQQKEQRSE